MAGGDLTIQIPKSYSSSHPNSHRINLAAITVTESKSRLSDEGAPQLKQRYLLCCGRFLVVLTFAPSQNVSMMILYLSSQRRTTSALAMFCWLLLSIYSCGSMASSHPASVMDMDNALSHCEITAANVADASGSHAEHNGALPALASVDADTACCDQLLQQLECCDKPLALHNGLSTDRSALFPDFNAVYITTVAPTDSWLAWYPLAPKHVSPRYSRWLMDSYPRPHLVYCTLIV